MMNPKSFKDNFHFFFQFLFNCDADLLTKSLWCFYYFAKFNDVFPSNCTCIILAVSWPSVKLKFHLNLVNIIEDIFAK